MPIFSFERLEITNLLEIVLKDLDYLKRECIILLDFKHKLALHPEKLKPLLVDKINLFTRFNEFINWLSFYGYHQRCKRSLFFLIYPELYFFNKDALDSFLYLLKSLSLKYNLIIYILSGNNYVVKDYGCKKDQIIY